MFERNMTTNAHKIIETHLMANKKEDLIAVDATVGNGFDLFFLAKCKAVHEVIGFDIQPQAISASYNKIKDVSKKIRLITASHHLISQFVNKPIDVAMFNLGYLPLADKTVTTYTETTLQAIRQVLEQMAPGGICTIMTYPGHSEGEAEHLAITQFFERYYEENKILFKLSLEQTKRPCPQLFVIIDRSLNKK